LFKKDLHLTSNWSL